MVGREESLWWDGRMGAHVPSTPDKGAFSKAEDRAMTCKAGVVCDTVKHGAVLALEPISYYSHPHPWLIECVHEWPDGGSGKDLISATGQLSRRKKERNTFELDIKHVLG